MGVGYYKNFQSTGCKPNEDVRRSGIEPVSALVNGGASLNLCFIVDTVFSQGGISRVVTVIANQFALEHNVSLCVFCGEDHPTSPYGLA